MNVNYDTLVTNIKGTSVPKPLSGTLSGHAAGEPFDKHVYNEIKKQLPHNTFRQYEYLNDLYSKNEITLITKKKEREDYQRMYPSKLIVANKKELLEKRTNLILSKTINYLLQRGEKETKKWDKTNPFDEKQDDTADILVVKDGFYEIIDVKTRNLQKDAQAPNIISAFKLAKMCQLMIDNQEFDMFTINYFDIDWESKDDKLVCKDAYFACLFKAPPEQLYINWAAAMQIQFHVCDLDQTFNGTMEEWAKSYLKHFVEQVHIRSKYMIEEYAKPFEKYID